MKALKDRPYTKQSGIESGLEQKMKDFPELEERSRDWDDDFSSKFDNLKQELFGEFGGGKGKDSEDLEDSEASSLPKRKSSAEPQKEKVPRSKDVSNRIDDLTGKRSAAKTKVSSEDRLEEVTNQISELEARKKNTTDETEKDDLERQLTELKGEQKRLLHVVDVSVGKREA